MGKTIEPTEVGDTALISTERRVRLAFRFALAVASYLSVVRVNETTAWVEHTHEVLSSLERLLAATTDSETAERGYVITGRRELFGALSTSGAGPRAAGMLRRNVSSPLGEHPR